MNKQSLHIESDDVRKIIHSWRDELIENRGYGADLRRCHDLTDVFFCPAYHGLYQRLLSKGDVNREALALIAVSLAHVRENAQEASFAQQMGSIKSGTNPQISERRFLRFITHKTYPSLFLPVIRIIKNLNGVINIDDLVKKLYYWNDSTRKNMTFDYYEKVLHIEEKQEGK